MVGQVRFSCPSDLVRALATASGIDAAVETGTFRAEGTLLLRGAVSRVWSVELSPTLHRRAVARYGSRSGLQFIKGSSDEVLPQLLETLNEPVIFWLDAHGGMIDQATNEIFDPAGEATQCPLIAELEALRNFTHHDTSCILIDDARTFLGPLPQHRSGDWPSLLDLVDLIRGTDRHVTILDDVIIAVPKALQGVVDRWWLDQVKDRDGRDGYQQALWEAYNPKPGPALRLLVKSVTPSFIRRMYEHLR